MRASDGGRGARRAFAPAALVALGALALPANVRAAHHVATDSAISPALAVKLDGWQAQAEQAGSRALQAAAVDRAEAQAAGAELSAAQRDLALRSEGLTERERRLRARVAAIYRMAQGGLARMLFEPQDQTELLLLDRDAAARLLERDRQELDELRAEARAVRASLDALGEKRDGALLRAADESRQAEQAGALVTALVVLRAEGVAAPAKELRAAAARLAELTGRDGALPTLRPPVAGAPAFPFGPYVDPPTRALLTRRGVLFRADEGTEVTAVAPGTVRFAGPLHGYGQAVVVDHGGGLVSLVGGLEEVGVSPGAHVATGDALGRSAPARAVASAPRTAPACVYLELRQDGVPIDPAPLLSK